MYTNMYIGIAGKAMVSNTALAWLGNGDVRIHINSSMLRNTGEKSATHSIKFTSVMIAISIKSEAKFRYMTIPPKKFLYSMFFGV